MPKLKKSHSIEPKPKQVHFLAGFRDTIGLRTRRPDLQDALFELIEHIHKGRPVPERFYRRNRSSTPDVLLENDGIMHLHLGDPSTPELVYLVQYDSHVVILEVTDHAHFRTTPPGKILKTLHSSKLSAWEGEREAEEETLRQRVRMGLRRPGKDGD